MQNATQSGGALDILSDYIERRRRGMKPSDVLTELRAQADHISSLEKSMLVVMIQDWESTQGAMTGQATSSVSSVTTMTVPIKKLAGMKASGATGSLGTLQHAPFMGSGSAHFAPDSTLLLHVRGGAEPILVDPGRETIIGRADPESPLRPDIDLAQYEAKSLGVSRLHSTLRRTKDALTLSDLASLNGTFLNGQVLHPAELRVLHDGDELWLGRLVIRVQFKTNIRRNS